MVYKNFFDLLRELAPQHKDSFRDMMRALNEDPLAFLIEDSYNSLLNGESFTVPDAVLPNESPISAAEEQTEPPVDTEVVGDAKESQGDVEDTAATGSDTATIDKEPEAALVSAPPAAANKSTAAGEIKTRDEVLDTLTQVQAFFERNEPSSPVPLIIQKVRNLVPKNFLDLLAEFDKVTDQESE